MNPEWTKTLSLPQVGLYVEKYGNAGPELIFIHGGPDWDHTHFLPFALPLAEHFQLYFYDLRGCGKSTRFGDSRKYQLEYNSGDLHQLINHLKLNKPILLGFSYGGHVALDFITRYPQQVKGLILASASVYKDYQADLDTWDEYHLRYTPELKHKINTMLKSDELTWEEKTRQLAELWMPLMFYRKDDETKYAPLIMKTDFSGEWIEAWQKGLLHEDNKDYVAHLQSLNLPLLMLHGEKDMILPASGATRAHEAIPGSQLVIIPGVSHMPHMEATDTWLAAIREFVNSRCS